MVTIEQKTRNDKISEQGAFVGELLLVSLQWYLLELRVRSGRVTQD